MQRFRFSPGITPGRDVGQEPAGSTRPLPKDHVIGAIARLQEAEEAVQALQKAGYPARDILLIPSNMFIDGLQERRQNAGRVRQALHAFFTSSDEGYPGDLYLEHARNGRNVLAVYASTDEQAQGIAQVLSTYHVHSLRYYGPLTVTSFPSL
ncbi:MAG: hypothetical protein M3069_19745 [Chloroflexota bacterium]|nr:hypothetical protein [Chloroflexota bacterium]